MAAAQPSASFFEIRMRLTPALEENRRPRRVRPAVFLSARVFRRAADKVPLLPNAVNAAHIRLLQRSTDVVSVPRSQHLDLLSAAPKRLRK
jgi:hypothetical protein